MLFSRETNLTNFSLLNQLEGPFLLIKFMRNKILNMYYNRIENFGGFMFRFGIFKTENQEILKRGVGDCLY